MTTTGLDEDAFYLEGVQFEMLVGLTLIEVTKVDAGLFLKATDGRMFVIKHEQECCECVDLIDISGDTNDLIGSQIVVAECRTNATDAAGENTYRYEYSSATWTFIEIATNKGSVTLRFYGASNGYYSETADLFLCKPFDYEQHTIKH